MDRKIEIILTEQGVDQVNAKLEQMSRKISGIRTKTKGLGADLTKLGSIAAQNIKLKVTITGVGTSKTGTGAYGQVSKLNTELTKTRRLLNDIKKINAFARVPGAPRNGGSGGSGRTPGGGSGGTRRVAGANSAARLAAGLRFAAAFPGGGFLSGLSTPLAGAGSAIGVLPGAAGLAATSLVTLAASAGIAASGVVNISKQAVTFAGSVQSASLALAALREDGASLAQQLRELALRTPGLNPENALELGTRFAATGATRDTILQAVTIAARAGALSQGNQQDLLGIKNALGDILSGNLTGQELRQLSNAGGGGALILRELSAIAGGRDKITSLEVNAQLFEDLAQRVNKVAMPMNSLAAVSERLDEAYKEVLLVLGDAMLPHIVEAMNGFIETLDEVKGDGGLKELGSALGELTIVVSELAKSSLPELVSVVTSSASSFADALRNPIQFLGGGAINKSIVDGVAKPALEDAYIAARGAVRAALATLDFLGVDTTPAAAGLDALQTGLHIASGKTTDSISEAQAKAVGGVGTPDSLPNLARKQLKQLETIAMNTANFRSDMDATLLDLHDLRTRRSSGNMVQSEVFGGTTVVEKMARANAHAARRLNERQLTYAAL